MKSIRFWYGILATTLLTITAILTVFLVINAKTKEIDSRADISHGITINDLNISANPNETYDNLNTNETINNAITTAIDKTKAITITKDDYTLTNNQLGRQKPNVNILFNVTAKSISKLIIGSFNFNINLQKADISQDVSVQDLNTVAETSNNYGSLNENFTIINTVISAINVAKSVVISRSDFILSNDQNISDQQLPGTLVTFTVTASNTSNQIKGSFTFIDTLGKIDISNSITITDTNIVFDPYGTYSDLNNTQSVSNIVINAVLTKFNLTIGNNDFTITNDQNPYAIQEAGTTVIMTVAATPESSLIIGSFNFKIVLIKPDITDIKITDPTSATNPKATYGDLNNDSTILQLIADAIYQAKKITVYGNTDFVVTNNQQATANQSIGTIVTFTVTAMGNQITGKFSFIDTLSKVNIDSEISVIDPLTAADPSQLYSALNTSTGIYNAVNTAISYFKGINVTGGDDYTLSNDQSGYQYPNVIVTFTVAATTSSNLITGSFTFTDTLGKVSIASGVKINDLKTPTNTNKTFGDLNSDTNIISAVINAILVNKSINVTTSDFNIRNNKSSSAKQVTNTVVTFTVVASNNSSLISGAFNFIDTLS